jgi:hypothetical protein
MLKPLDLDDTELTDFHERYNISAKPEYNNGNRFLST